MPGRGQQWYVEDRAERLVRVRVRVRVRDRDRDRDRDRVRLRLGVSSHQYVRAYAGGGVHILVQDPVVKCVPG